MAANLNININGPSGGVLGGGGGGGGFNQQNLTQIVALLKQQTTLLQQQTKILNQQTSSVTNVTQTYQQLNVQVNQTAININKVSKAAKDQVPANVDAAKAIADAWEREQRRIARSLQIEKALARAAKAAERAAAQIRRSLSGAFSGITSGRAFRTSGRAGISPGGILAGLGDVAAIGTRVAGDLVGGITKGLAAGAAAVTGGLSSLLSVIPKVGGVLSAGVSIAGNLVSGIVSGLGGAVSGLSKAVGDILSKVAGAAAKAFNRSLIAGLAVAGFSIRQAVKFEDLERSFQGLAEQIGTTSVEALDRLRGASRGTLSDLKLLENANQAVALGAATSVEDIEQLIVVSRRLGKIAGRDNVEAFNRLTLALGKQEQRLLDEIGLAVDAGAAYRKFAEDVGKSSQELTENEKRIAFRNAVFEEANRVLKEQGDEVLSTSDRFAQFNATISNLAVSIGASLAPALIDIIKPIERIADRLAEAFSRNRAAIVDGITKALDGLLTVLENLADISEREGLGGLFERLKESAVSLWEAFKQAAEAAIKFVLAEMQVLWERVKELAKDAVAEGIILGLENVGGPLGKLLAGPARSGLRSQQETTGASFDVRSQTNRNIFSNEIGDIRSTLAPLTRFVSELTRRDPISLAGNGGIDAVTGEPFSADLIQRAVASGTAEGLRQAAGGGGGGRASSAAGGLGPVGGVGAGATLGGGSVGDVFFRITSELRELIPGVVDLPGNLAAIVSGSLQSVAASEEETARVLARIERERQRLPLRALEASIDATEAAVKAAESEARNREKAADQINKDIDNARDKLSGALQRIGDDLADRIDDITRETSRKLGDLQRDIGSRTDSLLGGDRSNLPLNVRKGLEKAEREQRRIDKDAIRRATSGLSSDDIARGRFNNRGSFSFQAGGDPRFGIGQGFSFNRVQSDPRFGQLDASRNTGRSGFDPQESNDKIREAFDKIIESIDAPGEREKIITEAAEEIAKAEEEAAKKREEETEAFRNFSTTATDALARVVAASEAAAKVAKEQADRLKKLEQQQKEVDRALALLGGR